MNEIDAMDGWAFEQFVARFLDNEEYTDVEVTKGAGDNGVDILATKGHNRYAIQVKRYTGKVPRNAVSDAVGGIGAYFCNAAMVITNSRLSPQAYEFAARSNCEIVDRDVLIDWLTRYRNNERQTALVLEATKDREFEQFDLPAARSLNSAATEVPAHVEDTSVSNSSSHGAIGQEMETEATKLAAIVPPDVIAAAKLMASSDYPDDFDMQAHVFREEIAAYTKLQQLTYKDVSDHVMAILRTRALAEWPKSFNMQLHVIREQIKAYKRLQPYEPTGISADVLRRMRAKAAAEWPDNYSMQIDEVKRQARGYRSIADS